MQNIKFYLFIFFFILCLKTWSQPCFKNGLSFHNQASIDSFIINFPFCTEVESILISGDDIVDLSPLINIRKVTNSISFSGCPNLVSLNGLNNIDSIGETLRISNCNKIKSLNGFSTLKSLKSIVIMFNEGLESLLNNVNITLNEMKTIYIQSNPNLAAITGFDSLKYITKELVIVNNPKVKTFLGFKNIKRIFTFQVGGMNIENFKGLENLDYVIEVYIDDCSIKSFDYFSIDTLQWLTLKHIDFDPNISGFSNFPFIKRAWIFENNMNIYSLDAFRNLQFSNACTINCHYNNELSFCHIANICENISKYGQYGHSSFYENAIGCNHWIEVRDQCTTPTIDLDNSTSNVTYISQSIVNDHLSLYTTRKQKGKIVSVTGSLLKTFELNSELTEIDVSPLRAGMYFILLEKDHCIKFILSK